ncbi:MAG: hypothetical protein SFU99_01100, partial [Saprospiraceae bacterium]|nr:hypothetical protein [Saprospiraceae bacterium]
IEKIPPSDRQGVVQMLFNPLGIANQIIILQEFEQDASVGFLYDLLGKENFEIIRFIYRPSNKNRRRASISFHLTKRERESVLNAIHNTDNQSSLRHLMDALQ